MTLNRSKINSHFADSERVKNLVIFLLTFSELIKPFSSMLIHAYRKNKNTPIFSVAFSLLIQKKCYQLNTTIIHTRMTNNNKKETIT